MTFSKKLLMLRKERGLSQEELAEHLAVTRQAISRWENGETLPDAPNLLKLSNLFGVSVDALLRDDRACPEAGQSAAEAGAAASPVLQEATGRREGSGKKIPHLLCGFLWLIAAGCMVVAGTLSGMIYHVAIAFANTIVACIHFFYYFRRSGVWKNSPWHAMKKESRQYLTSAILFLFAAFCFFLAGAIGGNLLSTLAGIMELIASLGFFHRWHKSMINN